MDISIIAVAISSVAALAGALISFLLKAAISRPQYLVAANERQEVQNPEAECRLPEARALLSRQQSIAVWNKRANVSLTFAQYVVGGVLATSFAQQALSREMVGLLGVIVLVAKLVHQHYRPDLNHIFAKQRMQRLRSLIRKTEDGLFAIRTNTPDAPTILSLRTAVSEGIDTAEAHEVESFLENQKERMPNQRSDRTGDPLCGAHAGQP